MLKTISNHETVLQRSNRLLVRLLLFRIDIFALVVHRHTVPIPRRRHRSSSCINTAVTAYLALLVLDVLSGTLRRCCDLGVLSANGIVLADDQMTYLVLEHEDIVMLHEVPVDILESATCGLWIEEIYEWHEGSVEDGPDDVEFPA
jgi:hypothetical protein